MLQMRSERAMSLLLPPPAKTRVHSLLHLVLTRAKSIRLSPLSFPCRTCLCSPPLLTAPSIECLIKLSPQLTSGDEDRFLDHTLQLTLLLHKSTKRRIRKRATVHNSISWPLLPELTIKVFSLLDTKSLVQAFACCTMFNKCAMDRLCYSHIDLTMATKPVDNGLVRIMIHRAGKELRSLKLGSISPPDGTTTPLLTRSCLSPLSSDNGFSGALLRSLHLYNLRSIDSNTLCDVLSNCSDLTELKILGFEASLSHEKLSLDRAPVLRYVYYISLCNRFFNNVRVCGYLPQLNFVNAPTL